MKNGHEKTRDILDQLSLPKLEFSAQRGNPTAQCNLATHLMEAGDSSKAAIWNRFAAQQGYAQAQYNLGCQLLYGEGVEQNYLEAEQWFSKAAKQDYTNAIYNLAFMNELGLGCEIDKVKAYSLYQEAANRGDSDSQCKLAMILLDKSARKRAGIKSQGHGWSVTSNQEKARELLELASNNGHKLSTDILIKLRWR